MRAAMAHGGRATTSHGSFRVLLVRPDELGETESACWAAFRRDAPEAASPFMSLTFRADRRGGAPGARVAIIDNADGIQGFLPLEINGHRTARPLGGR
jgi:CelD/BcsL family acetyltransferase involved in cellulose biosynthesis